MGRTSALPRPRTALLPALLALLLIFLAGCTPIQPAQPAAVVAPEITPTPEATATPDAQEADLRAEAWDYAIEMLADDDDEEEDAAFLNVACKSPVLVSHADYKQLYEKYTWPVFWTVHLNFALTRDGDATDLATVQSPLVACLVLYWRDVDAQIYVPNMYWSEESDLVYARGVPILCYRMGPEEGISVANAMPDAILVTGESHSGWESWTASFTPPAGLWCPLDIAAGMNAYVFNNGAPDDDFLNEMDNLDMDATVATDAITMHVSDLADWPVEAYTHFISIAALRRIDADTITHPLIDYVPICDFGTGCASGSRFGLTVTDSPDGTYTMYGGLTPGPNYVSQTPPANGCTDVPPEHPDTADFEYCDMPLPDARANPLYVVADLGEVATAGPPAGVCTLQPTFMRFRALDYESGDWYGGTFRSCSGVNLDPPLGPDPIEFWVGPTDLYIGHTPGTSNFFSGDMDYIWFDPNQSVRPPG